MQYGARRTRSFRAPLQNRQVKQFFAPIGDISRRYLVLHDAFVHHASPGLPNFRVRSFPKWNSPAAQRRIRNDSYSCPSRNRTSHNGPMRLSTSLLRSTVIDGTPMTLLALVTSEMDTLQRLATSKSGQTPSAHRIPGAFASKPSISSWFLP